MSVVLPAPFGPEQAEELAGRDLEVDAVEGDDGLRLDVVDAADAAHRRWRAAGSGALGSNGHRSPREVAGGIAAA